MLEDINSLIKSLIENQTKVVGQMQISLDLSSESLLKMMEAESSTESIAKSLMENLKNKGKKP